MMEAATLCDGRWRRPRPRRRRACCTPRRSASRSRPPCSRRPRDPRERRHPPHRPSWRPHRAARHAAPPSRAQAQYPSVALPRDHICKDQAPGIAGTTCCRVYGTLTDTMDLGTICVCCGMSRQRERTVADSTRPFRLRPVHVHVTSMKRSRGCPPFRPRCAPPPAPLRAKPHVRAGSQVDPHGVDIELQPARVVQATPAGRQGQLRQGLPGAGALHERDAGRSACE